MAPIAAAHPAPYVAMFNPDHLLNTILEEDPLTYGMTEHEQSIWYREGLSLLIISSVLFGLFIQVGSMFTIKIVERENRPWINTIYSLAPPILAFVTMLAAPGAMHYAFVMPETTPHKLCQKPTWIPNPCFFEGIRLWLTNSDSTLHIYDSPESWKYECIVIGLCILAWSAIGLWRWLYKLKPSWLSWKDEGEDDHDYNEDYDEDYDAGYGEDYDEGYDDDYDECYDEDDEGREENEKDEQDEDEEILPNTKPSVRRNSI